MGASFTALVATGAGRPRLGIGEGRGSSVGATYILRNMFYLFGMRLATLGITAASRSRKKRPRCTMSRFLP